jgi:hypothetical protein
MNLALYECQHHEPKYDAQRNLASRSHYVDDRTLVYFGSRILHAEHAARGTLYLLIESRGVESRAGRRGMRVVVFNLAGRVVAHASADTWYPTTRAARRAIPAILESIDARAENARALDSLETWNAEEIRRARARLSQALETATA